MNAVKTWVVLSSSLLLLACNEDYKGTLTVAEPIQLKLKKEKPLDLAQGSYTAALKQGSGNLKLNIEVNGEKESVKFNLKDGQSLDTGARELSVLASESGQPYDLALARKTTVQESEPYRGTETCTYLDSEYICRHYGGGRVCRDVKECDPRNPQRCEIRRVCRDEPVRKVCGWETVSRYGNKDVVYTVVSSRTYVAAELRKPGTDVAAARFDAIGDITSHRNYSYYGECRRY